MKTTVETVEFLHTMFPLFNKEYVNESANIVDDNGTVWFALDNVKIGAEKLAIKAFAEYMTGETFDGDLHNTTFYIGFSYTTEKTNCIASVGMEIIDKQPFIRKSLPIIFYRNSGSLDYGEVVALHLFCKYAADWTIKYIRNDIFGAMELPGEFRSDNLIGGTYCHSRSVNDRAVFYIMPEWWKHSLFPKYTKWEEFVDKRLKTQQRSGIFMAVSCD